MAIRPILIHPDPRLKKVCDPVPVIDAAVQGLAEDMLATMYAAPGVGLAAPQVGITQQIFVMDCAGKDNAPQPMVLINPRVTWMSETTRLHEEGCLSIPEIYEDVTRPDRVRVAFTDLSGVGREEEFDGLWSTCAQHEIDHLNGRLFIDYLGAVRRAMITAKMRKLKRARAE